MLMQVHSGLTRYQVQKAKQNLPFNAAHIAPAFQFRPELVVVAGVSVILLALHEALAAEILAVSAVALTLLVHRLLQHWSARFNEQRNQVLVVRDGLIHQVAVQALVPGDTLQLQAGSRLPVDVNMPNGAVVPTGLLAVLLRLTGRKIEPGVGIAGSVVLKDCQATVLARGGDCVVATAVLPDWAEQQQMTLQPLAAAMLGATAAAMTQLIQQIPVAVSLHVKQMLTYLQKKINATSLVEVTLAFMYHMTLVGHTRHHSSEAAFRYNQDPVSWSLA